MKKLNPILALAMASAATLFAQEATTENTAEQPATELPPLTVTATRVVMPTAKLAQSYSIITSTDIEEARFQNAIDALRDDVGISLCSYGPYDQSAQISIRGMRGYHTKLLIDGIPYMDNAATQGYDSMVSCLSLMDVDHIELVKGATSLQGSSAMGGVINIITKRPTEDGIHGRIAVEAGSHERLNTSALILGKYDIVDFKLGIGRESERGISAVASDANGNVNMDNDVYRGMTYTAGIGIQFTPEWRMEFNGTFQDIDEEYDEGYLYTLYDDNFNPVTGVVLDPDNVWVRRNLASGKLIGKELFDGKLDLCLEYAFTRSDRAYRDRKNTTTNSRWIGDMQFLNGQATYHINDWNDLTIGVEYIDGSVEDITSHRRDLKRSHYTTAGFVGYQLEPVQNLFLALNGRYTEHSAFGDEWTGDASAKYYLEQTGTTFRTSVGKGYRSPNVFELYTFNSYTYWGTVYITEGNPNLKPETNRSWEIGWDQEFLEKKLCIGATYFENHVKNFIVNDNGIPRSTYTQIKGVSILGAESYVEIKPNEQFSLKAAYSYLHARDRNADWNHPHPYWYNNKHTIAYVPRHKASLDATWYPMENKKLSINLGGYWTGSRWNGNGTAANEKLDAYMLLHTAVSYKLLDNLQIYGRIENLLNTNYTLRYNGGSRYNTYGRCYYIGVVFTF